MGIVLLFDWDEANVPFFMERFSLVKKDSSRIKVFEPFEDNYKRSSLINMIFLFLMVLLRSNQVSQL